MQLAANSAAERPIVLVTGAAGAIGSSLVQALQPDYRVVGLDRIEGTGADGFIVGDVTDEQSMQAAFRAFRGPYGTAIASVVHLAAYFDFTGEANPLYDAVNVEGTRRLLRGLREFAVEQFVYSAPCCPRSLRTGGHIDESAAIVPKWAYPQSRRQPRKWSAGSAAPSRRLSALGRPLRRPHGGPHPGPPDCPHLRARHAQPPLLGQPGGRPVARPLEDMIGRSGGPSPAGRTAGGTTLLIGEPEAMVIASFRIDWAADPRRGRVADDVLAQAAGRRRGLDGTQTERWCRTPSTRARTVHPPVHGGHGRRPLCPQH